MESVWYLYLIGVSLIGVLLIAPLYIHKKQHRKSMNAFQRYISETTQSEPTLE